MRYRLPIASLLDRQRGQTFRERLRRCRVAPIAIAPMGSWWRRPGSRRCAAVNATSSQCERSTGSGGLATMVFVAPPRMKSCMRECP